MNKISGKVVGNTTTTPVAISNAANALKGFASGCLLVLTDVSPIKHDIIACEDAGATAIVRSGKNQFNGSLVSGAWLYEDGKYSSTASGYVTCAEKIPILGGKQYTLSFTANKGNMNGVVFYDWDGKFISGDSTIRANPYTFTIPDEASYMCFNFYASGLTIGDIETVLLEFGSTKTEYEPYVEPIEYDSDQEPIKIPSLYPTTVLRGLGGSEVITAEYNRDINRGVEDVLGKSKEHTDKTIEPAIIVDSAENDGNLLEKINSDCADAPLKSITLYGKSTQAETPSIDNPQGFIDVINSGDKVTIQVDKDAMEITEVSFTMPVALKGIPVSNGGQYVDENGQQWCCDEVSLFDKEVHSRICDYTITGNESWYSKFETNVAGCYRYVLSSVNSPMLLMGSVNGALCTHFNFVDYSVIENSPANSFAFYSGAVHVVSNLPTLNEFVMMLKEKYASDNPIVIRYPQYASFSELSLTNDKINQLKQLRTHGQDCITDIYISPEVHAKFDYVATHKAYVDKEIANSISVFDQNKAEKTDLNNHISDEEKHITNSERTNWDDKYSKAEIKNLLSEKESISNKATTINDGANNNSYPTTKAVKDYVDDTKDDLEAFKKESSLTFSNILKGHVSGCPLVLSDVSPIEHEILVIEDVGGIYIARCGKNLFNYKDWVEYCANGGTRPGKAVESVNYLGEDCFSYANMPQDTSLRFDMGGRFLPNTQYTFTVEYATSKGVVDKNTPVFLIHYTDGSTEYIQDMAYTDKFTQVTKTTALGKTVLGFRVPTNDVNATIYIKKNMQIEIGSNPTELEPYVEPVMYYSDGDTIKIPSLYPTTVLYAEGAETVVAAEYNRDVGKVIANKEDITNKSSTIGESANNTTYPTTKAVREYVESKFDSLLSASIDSGVLKLKKESGSYNASIQNGVLTLS